MGETGIPATFNLDIPGPKTATYEPLDGEITTQPVSEFRVAPAATVRGMSSEWTPERNVAGSDIVELEWSEGAIWVTSAEQLALDLAAAEKSGLTDATGIKEKTLKLSPALGASAETRGARPGLSAIRLIRVAKAIETTVRSVLQAYENHVLGSAGVMRVRSLDERVGDPVSETTALEAGKSCLVLVHGTGSSTVGSFGQLHDTKAWSQIRKEYGDRVLGLQHRTLSESPAFNALELVKALPRRTTIDLLTHSRGGLVGELLSAELDDDSIAALRLARDGDDADELNALADQLTELAALRRQKEITVERFVRVACPARGTALMTKRLDVLLNVVLHALSFLPGLQGNPLWKAFNTLVRKLVHMRTKPTAAPGLWCMRPGGRFIELVNDLRAEDESRLAVISGDARSEGLWGRLKAFLPELFFGGRNDLVVETESMYGGAQRERIHDSFHRSKRGSKINHFLFFANRDVQERIATFFSREECPCVDDAQPAAAVAATRGATRGFWQGAWEVVGLGGVLKPPRRRGGRDVVILIPGIMGSHLAEGASADRVWLKAWALRRGGMARLGIDNDTVRADGPVAFAYERIVDHLDKQYDVVFADFDWRKSLSAAAAKLERIIRHELDTHNHTVRVLAHSMGGLRRTHDDGRALRDLGAPAAERRSLGDARYTESRLARDRRVAPEEGSALRDARQVRSRVQRRRAREDHSPLSRRARDAYRATTVSMNRPSGGSAAVRPQSS